MTTTRAERAKALERWADEVDTGCRVEAKTAALRSITELVGDAPTRPAFAGRDRGANAR